MAGEQVPNVISEAGGAAHLLGDEGKLTAKTGQTAAILWLWKHIPQSHDYTF